ncbi:MAG: hypothetical protein QG651_651 [Pseudomonadota bacterium]|nr:hypothetical protein [Pseudomonadota bacterium]
MLLNLIPTWSEYLQDVTERNILFLDVMRRRGNDMVVMTTDDKATVLNFPLEIILDGAYFAQPINYWLARILPLDGIPTDENKRPYVVQDPRAGRGPGIAGFKKESEIGAALKHGHPVYFIGFNAEPIAEQTFEEVIHGQVNFYQHVADLHPNSPKLCAIGNCAAGYLSMFSAMQKPEIFGPVLIAGSPLSYWNGEHGRNPMRYSGGFVGGSWLISLLGDLGGGKFDGTNLVMNFNILNFDNFIWGKQYDLFSKIDQEAERFLQFERWLGSFGELNTTEIRWMVEQLFVGNKLTTGQLCTSDGLHLDPRLITSPIVTFVSDGDNISPPAQSAGWIADLYSDVEEIIARGKTIIYCLNHKVGHLALFTGSKIAKRENQLFVENMDTIDLLPPGLYELILDTPEGQENNASLVARYVARTIEDVKALGCNSESDDRAFATLAKASNALQNSYDSYIHPLFKMYHNPVVATLAKNLQPLRWSYWLFAEQYNPWISGVSKLAEQVKSQRHPVDENNSFLQIQGSVAKFIADSLRDIQDKRDKAQERWFFDFWGNQLVQKYWDTFEQIPRYTPSLTKFEREKLIQNYNAEIKQKLVVNNHLEAVFRVIALLLAKRHEVQVTTASILVKWAKSNNSELSLEELRDIISSQFMVVWEQPELALAELRQFVVLKPAAIKLVVMVKEILSLVGAVSPRMIKALYELALKLNITDLRK